MSASFEDGNNEPIPISALQHAVYCPRQAALIHLERLWAENRFTAEGHVLHLASAIPRERRHGNARRVTALSLASTRLGIAGIADLVEFRKGPSGEIPYPVEYKRGKAKIHRADEVQLCAQALCLEEMTGAPVPDGALFYGETKRRVAVPFDRDLRRLTEETVETLRTIFQTRETPRAVYKAGRCRNCSLLELCRPKIAGRSVRHWRHKMIATALTRETPS